MAAAVAEAVAVEMFPPKAAVYVLLSSFKFASVGLRSLCFLSGCNTGPPLTCWGQQCRENGQAWLNSCSSGCLHLLGVPP